MEVSIGNYDITFYAKDPMYEEQAELLNKLWQFLREKEVKSLPSGSPFSSLPIQVSGKGY